MNEYRGRHAPSQPWAVASSASRHYRGRHRTKNRRRRRWIIAGIVLLALLLIYPFMEPHLLQVDRVNLRAEALPSDIGRLRIVYLSDIHYGFAFSDADLSRLITRINQLKPDLVLFGGGYGADPESAVRFFRRLPSIHARYGLLGVIGDSDREESGDDLTAMTDAMRNAGVTPLVNTVSQVRIGSASIYVAGLDDVLKGSPDLESLSRQVSAEDYVIFLSHNPSVIPDSQLVTDSQNRLGWYDLGLFGHTHGGQIPFLSSLLDIGEDVPDRYRSGWFTENRVDMLVSRGVGTSVIPARFLCYPQIHEINIYVN